jgi:hypothetical protein
VKLFLPGNSVVSTPGKTPAQGSAANTGNYRKRFKPLSLENFTLNNKTNEN